MGLNANSRCPECDTKVYVQLADKDGLVDSVVRATSEEVIMEVSCKEEDCDRVWRVVYAFAGNQC